MHEGTYSILEQRLSLIFFFLSMVKEGQPNAGISHYCRVWELVHSLTLIFSKCAHAKRVTYTLCNLKTRPDLPILSVIGMYNCVDKKSS